MLKNKPPLKRSFPRSSPHDRSGSAAFAIALVVIIFMTWVLIRVVHHSGPVIPPKIAHKEPAPMLRPRLHPTTPIASANAAPIVRKPPILPETIIIEKDSMTYPGQAPRMEHPKPIFTPPQGHRPIDWSKPVIAFVIDDIGHEIKYDQVINQLGDHITYSILPYLKYSEYYGEKSLQTGADVILHLPLESEKGLYPGPGLITRNMPADEIREAVAENLDSIPHYIGANNHMGSLGTSDSGFMKIVLTEFKKRNLFFLDSYTSPRSQVVQICHQLHIPVLRRDVFLDNIEETGPIREQINRTAQIARRTGFAIAIGHYKKYTLESLAEEIPKLEAQGFQIVKLSDLIKRYN